MPIQPQRYLKTMLPGVLSFFLVPVTLAAETVSFTYHPPDDLTYQVNFEAVQKKTMRNGEETKTQNEDITLTKSVHVSKTDAGWAEVHDVDSLAMYRNGQQIENPLVNATLKRSVTYHISAEGELTDVAGYEGIAEELEGKLPAKFIQNIARAISPERLSARDIAEWNGRFGGLTGKTVEVGSVDTKTTPYHLPTGDLVDYTTTTEYVGWEDCDGRPCFRIEQSYSGDMQEAAEAILDRAHKLTEKFRAGEEEGSQVPEQMEAILEGKTEILLDPETLLPFYEKQDRYLRMVANLPGQGPVPIEQTSRKTMTYTYGVE